MADSNKKNFNKSTFSIAWKNLTFQVTQLSGFKFKNKIILNKLTGSFTPGSLNGVLGPSGAGKTTLLNCLSGTVNSGLIEGSEIYLNTTSTVSYYIRQHVNESIVSELTVGQILYYAFKFKNESKNTNELHQHITKIMTELMLPANLKSRPFAHCSGGEQKRVAIAQELMTLSAPAFLFLDEPTTGLDSASSYQVMLCLQNLAKNSNITIIASIHSPNNETLNLFNHLYVLAKEGVCIYSASPDQIQTHLEVVLNVNIQKHHQPPIEALLKIACNCLPNKSVLKLANETLSKNTTTLTLAISTLTLKPNEHLVTYKSFTISNLITQLERLFRITFIAQIKTFLFQLLLFVLYFTTLNTIFSSNMSTSSGCISNLNSTNCSKVKQVVFNDIVQMNEHYMSFVVMLTGFIFMITSTVFYSVQLKVFQNEHRNYWYNMGVYYLSSNIISFFELNITALLIAILSYFLSNQHAADNYSLNWTRFTIYLLFIWLLCLYHQAVGQLIGIILVNQPHIAVLLCELVYSIFCLLNGIYVKLHRSEIALLGHINNWLGMAYTTYGIYYAIFGVDRCNQKTEYSTILRDHNIDGNQIGYYACRILINTAVVKLTTLAMMYFKFNISGLKRRNNNKNNNSDKLKTDELTLDDCDKIWMNKIELPQKTKNEMKSIDIKLQFNKFSKNKILIAWRNLSLSSARSIFEIGSKAATNDDSLILKHLNGQFCFGTFNALMGTSGSGKTSLLRVLNGQCKTRLSDETTIYLSKYTKITTCFITQEVSNHLMPGLTAKQMVIFASKLKNSHKNINHEQIAVRWLQELDLMNTVNTQVDLCSGGEQKRLAVALELTSLEMPNLICIDEPTSGLDTNSAEIVISALRKLTHSHPLTIITSIHQPTIEVLNMFDQLYVLSRGGVCLYYGQPNQIQAYLNQVPDLIQTHYPIEALIKQSCFDYKNQINQKLVQLNNQHFNNNQTDLKLHEQTQLAPDGVLLNRPRFSLNSFLNLSHRYLYYIYGYLWKEWLIYFIISIIFALNLRLLYSIKIIYQSGCINLEDDLTDTCSKTEQQIDEQFLFVDNLRYNYFFTIIYILLVLISSSVNFYNEFPFFVNEHRNGMYSSGSFYLMKSLIEVIPLIVTNLIYVYILNIYDPVVASGIYWQLVYLLTLAQVATIGMGHCYSLLAGSNFTIQMILLVGTYFLFLIISNTFIPFNDMHYFWQILSNLSISRFIFETTTLLMYGFGRCRPNEVQALLYTISIDDTNYYTGLYMLTFNLIFYRIIAMYLLVRKVNPIEDRRKRATRIVKYNNEKRQIIEIK